MYRQGLGDYITVRCECGEHLAIREAEARLNATERLSAEMARGAIEAKGFVGGFLSALRAYADILDEKDG
jgi:hypothetical protein